MLKRKISKVLEEWKCEENKQCLLIRGARQVGKTFIIEEFCKNNYDSGDALLLRLFLFIFLG